LYVSFLPAVEAGIARIELFLVAAEDDAAFRDVAVF
jgi:hypothetical protein